MGSKIPATKLHRHICQKLESGIKNLENLKDKSTYHNLFLLSRAYIFLSVIQLVHEIKCSHWYFICSREAWRWRGRWGIEGREHIIPHPFLRASREDGEKKLKLKSMSVALALSFWTSQATNCFFKIRFRYLFAFICARSMHSSCVLEFWLGIVAFKHHNFLT